MHNIGHPGKNGKRAKNGGFPELLHEMHEDQIWNTLLSMIREDLCINTHIVRPETRFVEDLGADWLDLVDMIIAAAQRFDLHIPDEDVAAVVTVEDAYECLTRRLGASGIHAEHEKSTNLFTSNTRPKTI